MWVSDLSLPERGREHALHYEPLNGDIAECVSRLRIPHEQFTFVDLGAGKGKVVLMATALPFRSAIGVELSPTLIDIARRNCARYHNSNQKCRQIQMILADVAEYVLPSESLVLFTAHSFDDAVMRQVVENLRRSLGRHPRDVYFIYWNPVYRAVLEEAGFLRSIDATERWMTYQVDLNQV